MYSYIGIDGHICMAPTGNKFVVPPLLVQLPIYTPHSLGPMAIRLSTYMYTSAIALADVVNIHIHVYIFCVKNKASS